MPGGNQDPVGKLLLGKWDNLETPKCSEYCIRGCESSATWVSRERKAKVKWTEFRRWHFSSVYKPKPWLHSEIAYCLWIVLLVEIKPLGGVCSDLEVLYEILWCHACNLSFLCHVCKPVKLISSQVPSLASRPGCLCLGVLRHLGWSSSHRAVRFADLAS